MFGAHSYFLFSLALLALATPPTETITTELATTTTTSQTATQTISFVYDASRTVQNISAPQRAIMWNMCKGISGQLGQPSQSITLTRADAETKASNRNAMCPIRLCESGAWKSYFNKYYPEGIPDRARDAIRVSKELECNEFPPASSVEGGNWRTGGFHFCIPSTENGWQGGTMSSYFKPGNKNYIEVGEKFIMKIVGWNCTTQKPDPPAKPQENDQQSNVNVPRDITLRGESLYSSWDPENPKSRMLVMPLGILLHGSYTVGLSLKGKLESISLIDYGGTSYAFNMSDGIIAFTINQTADSLHIIGITEDSSVQVSYLLNKLSPPTSAASTMGARSIYIGLVISLLGTTTIMLCHLLGSGFQ